MKLVGRDILADFCERHTDAKDQVESWVAEVEAAKWQKPLDIKERYASASILPDNKVVFNIKGNSYRLAVKVSYKNQIVVVLNIGTHAEYSSWKL